MIRLRRLFAHSFLHADLCPFFSLARLSAREFWCSHRKSDPHFADKIRHVRDPKTRMAVVWGHCKGKMICEADEPKEDGEDGAAQGPAKPGHGGCGHPQPQIRKEGLKLFLQYKKSKDDDEVCLFDCSIFTP